MKSTNGSSRILAAHSPSRPGAGSARAFATPTVAILAVATLAVLVPLAAPGPAQKKSDASATPSRAAAPIVAAKVDDVPIHVHLLEADLRSSLKGRKLTAAARQVLQAEILDRAIQRIAIIRHLRDTAQGAKPAQVDAAIDHLRKQLASQNTTLESFLRTSNMQMADLRLKLSWQICWGQYLKRFVTEENLRRYFDSHRREFDGTQLRVQHLLLKHDAKGSIEHQAEIEEKAAEIRARIVSGKLTFGDAARQYSQSPSKEKGGDIGWISRHQPMVESFSQAAFALDVGKVSPPVRTPFGVHLIHCGEVRSGKKSWQDCESALRKAVADYLFQWLGKQARTKAKITYTEAWPHFQPGTRRISK